MGTVSPVSQTDMKFLSFLLCVSLTAAAIVRREAEPGGYGAEPQCTVTPVKECKQRTVETPKKVCQTVVVTPRGKHSLTLSANTRAPQPPLATCPSLHLSWSTMCPHLWSKQHPPRPLPLSALQPQ